MVSTKLETKKIDKLEHVEWVGIMKVILNIYGNVVKPTKYS